MKVTIVGMLFCQDERLLPTINHNAFTLLPRQPPDEGVKPKNPGIHLLQSVVLSTPG